MEIFLIDNAISYKITFANIVQLKIFTAAQLTLSCDTGRQTL